MKIVDLTYPFRQQMPVFPGDTPPIWEQVAHIERDGYNASQLRTGMHVGTHIDAPLHMIAGGKPLSVFPPEYFIGPALLINAAGQERVEATYLEGIDLTSVAIVLVYTGWGQYFGAAKYYLDYPELRLEFAQRLVDAGIRIVGLDFPSPDRAPYQVHRCLLGNEVLIIENLMNMQELLPYSRFELIALPARYEADGAPVRVIARVQEV